MFLSFEQGLDASILFTVTALLVILVTLIVAVLFAIIYVVVWYLSTLDGLASYAQTLTTLRQKLRQK